MAWSKQVVYFCERNAFGSCYNTNKMLSSNCILDLITLSPLLMKKSDAIQKPQIVKVNYTYLPKYLYSVGMLFDFITETLIYNSKHSQIYLCVFISEYWWRWYVKIIITHKYEFELFILKTCKHVHFCEGGGGHVRLRTHFLWKSGRLWISTDQHS